MEEEGRGVRCDDDDDDDRRRRVGALLRAGMRAARRRQSGEVGTTGVKSCGETNASNGGRADATTTHGGGSDGAGGSPSSSSSLPTSSPQTKSRPDAEGEEDAYGAVERQLRGLRTVGRLRELLRRNNRRGRGDGIETGPEKFAVTRVLGCPVDENDDDDGGKELSVQTQMAKEHGAVLLRNFVPVETDRIALAALVLRPLAGPSDRGGGGKCGDATGGGGGGVDKTRRRVPADAGVVAQTNFGSQAAEAKTMAAAMAAAAPSSSSPNGHGSSENDAPEKKRRRVRVPPAPVPLSFPLSKLRYLNLGVWNYDWGKRRYDEVRYDGALPLPERFSILARRALRMAAEVGAGTTEVGSAATDDGSRAMATTTTPVPDFNMAIANFYHLERNSDRLGGHKDDVESDLTQPLVAISLGAPGVFLLGGASRAVEPTAVLLRAGDCLVLGGKSRGYYHGVPSVLEYDDEGIGSEGASVFPELQVNDDDGNGAWDARTAVPSTDERSFAREFLKTVRINLSIRQV